jgi:eukaryotic-like serine/threonine-protein kinase
MIRRFETEPMDRDEQLGEAIETFLALAEEGPPPDAESFAARYPDLGEDLRDALEGLALVRGLVGDQAGPGNRLEAGHRIAGYRIVRELGRGGMGIVYEAMHVDLDRPVALKVLGSHAAPDSISRRRFLNEARTAAGLHHTHIVPVFDVGQVGGLCYYAMQRIEGSGLDQVLKVMRRDRTTAAGSNSGRGGAATVLVTPPPITAGKAAAALSGPPPDTATWVAGARPTEIRGAAAVRPVSARAGVDSDLPLFEPPSGAAYYRWVAEVGRRAAEALGHAHGRGIIHRDIKPSNLLVDARGSVWVADFGLARRLTDPGLTQSDGLMGTPRYMSPEQVDNGPVDGRTDIYSLGATLYELLTLRPPFDGRSTVELSRQIASKEPAPPRQADKRIPLDLETIVLKAMAKRPSDRYASASELSDDLMRFLGHEPVKARRIGPLGRMLRFTRRHPSLSAVSTAASVTVLAVATIAYARVVQERDRAIQARTETQAAMEKIKAANRETQKALGGQLLSTASVTRLSPIPNRRDRGLKLLEQAAALTPEPALLAELRDEAVEFLSLRDVEARRPNIPTGKTHGLAFGPEATRLATISDDGTDFRLWDVAKHRLVVEQSLHTGPGSTETPAGPPGLNPANRRIAVAGPYIAVIWENGQGIRLFDSSTGDSFNQPMPGHEIVSLITSPDGQRLVTVERERVRDDARPGGPAGKEGRISSYRINLWDPEHLEAPLAALMDPKAESRQSASDGPRRLGWPPLLAISPDGETIATARSFDPNVSLWSKNGEFRGDFDTRVRLSALALGPDGLLASAGDGSLQLWQLDFRSAPSDPNATSVSPLATRQSLVQLLRFSPSGTMLAVMGSNTGIELWDLSADTMVATLPTPDRVNDVAFSPNGRLLAAGGLADSVSVWAIVDPIGVVRLPEFKSQLKSLSFGPDGLLAMASRTGELRFWGPDDCPAARRAWDRFTPGALTFDGQQRLVTVDSSAMLRIPRVDAAADPERFVLPGPVRRRGVPGPFWVSIARSTNGQILVISRRSELWIFHSGKGEGLRRLTLEGMPESSTDFGRGRNGMLSWREIAVSPAGDRLYLTSNEEDFSAWTISGGRGKRLSWDVATKVSSLALSPDGKTLALGDHSGSVSVMDTARFMLRSRLTQDADSSSPSADDRISSLAFSPEGDELAIGSRDQVRLWSLGPMPTLLVRLPSRRGSVLALAYDSAGRHLAIGADKVVDVWNLDRLRRELNPLGLGW